MTDGKAKRQITIMLQPPGQKAQLLATLTYQLDPEREQVMGIRQDVALPDGSSLRVESAVMEPSGNLSIAIHRPRVQPLLATCRWAEVDPYFGIGLDGVGVIHFYLQRV